MIDDDYLQGLAATEDDEEEPTTFFANLVRERELGVEGRTKRAAAPGGAEWAPKTTSLKKVVGDSDSLACMWVERKREGGQVRHAQNGSSTTM